jgi:hypothetical protein
MLKRAMMWIHSALVSWKCKQQWIRGMSEVPLPTEKVREGNEHEIAAMFAHDTYNVFHANERQL